MHFNGLVVWLSASLLTPEVVVHDITTDTCVLYLPATVFPHEAGIVKKEHFSNGNQ